MKLKHIRKLIGLYGSRKAVVVVVIILGVLTACLEGVGAGLIVPLFKSLVNTGTESSNTGFIGYLSSPFAKIDVEYRLITVLAVYLGVIVIKNVILWSNDSLIKWFVYRVRQDITNMIYRQILAVGYRFIQANRQGTIYTWIAEEPARTAESLGGVLQLLTYGLILLIYVFILGAISWKMTLLGLGLSVALAISMNHLSKTLEQIGVETSETSRELSSYWIEALQSMRIIRLFGREEYEQKRHDRVWKKFHMNALKKACYTALMSPLSEILTTVLVVVILIMSSKMMRMDSTNLLPMLVAFLFVMYRIQANAGKINSMRMTLASHLAGVEQVISVLETNDKPYIQSGVQPIQEFTQGIRFENVNYRYPTSQNNVLENTTFDVPSGKVTAFVGVSGSGKSTLLDLILRLDDPSSGRILVDDRPLPEYRLEDWRHLIGMVDQETFIFNASVADNIRYGLLNASDEQIVEAARHANAHEFICLLSDGYNTLLGDRGTRLSGGQRQRIAIARAVLRNAQILIFDEATSSLDSESERLIHSAIRRLSLHRTVIIVAHRLSTVAHANNIIILDNGQIREMGTHDDLLMKKGRYFDLFSAQSEGLVMPL